MKRPKKECGHWSISLTRRECEDCGKVVTLEVDTLRDQEEKREMHNAQAIAAMRSNGNGEMFDR